MRRQTRAYIESLLEDYMNYYKHKAQREFELRHPFIPVDENVGGGKAQFKPNDSVDRMLITLDEDVRLNNLRREHFAIKVCYEEAPEYVQQIVNELYFKPPRNRKYLTIADLVVAHVIPVSKTKAYDAFNDFLENIAKDLKLHY
ncbi:transcriptional regulator [Lactobacillus taiwanensis]|uniref:transcriptional regulator n=1 Tax=Lactobacillus taiwanensis TaxID=508451 RepID=UPI00248C8723|nr:transcriptional regulator [Lactobacillus taiwanensis]